MKLTAIFLIAACLQLSAAGYGQKITISEKNVSLEKVFKEIEKQSGYLFWYKISLLEQAKKININLKDASIEEALKECFAGQPLSYSIIGKTVVIKSQPAGVKVESPLISPPIDIKGRVINEKGEPMVGVSVINKRTGKGTTTNAEGSFTIDAEKNDVLEFSFVGYRTYQYKISGQISYIPMKLYVKISSLEETIVIGYGTAKRKDLTGSVASVNTTEIKNIPFTSVDQALAGKAAGVQVVQADGSPGGVARIRIRGGASLIGGNDPLYIIDGVPVTIQNKFIQNASEITNPVEQYTGFGQVLNNSVSGSFARGLNNLAGLNINDIESIDILKDASATAIYGSKAANGVIIITTKKGKLNTKPILEVNYYAGLNRPLKEKVLNAEQYKMVMKGAAQRLNEERARIGRQPDATATNIVNNPNFFGTANTDWLDLVLRAGFTQNADIAVRGGGSGSRYYTSLAYTKQSGTLIGTDFTRISGKISLDNEITSRLRVITNLDYGFSTNNITNGIYAQALYAPPTENPYNADGSFSNPGSIGPFRPTFQNPLAVASGINQAKNISLIGSVALEYDVMKDLKFRTVTSVNYGNYHQLNYVPSYVDVASGIFSSLSSHGGTGSQSSSTSTNAFFENTLTWNKEFNKNNRLNVLAGTSWEKYRSNFFSASGRQYPDDNFLNNLNSAATPVEVKGSDPASQNSLLSFYLRANYAYKEKWLVTFTGRSDASSKFSPNNQVGYFPSGAVAWRISEEKFLKKATWIDELKLRVSTGLTGTQNIGDHLWRTLYTPVAYAGSNALIPTQLGNERIKWESTLQKDLGLDFSFFKARLRGTFGYYEKITDGLLLNISAAPSSAFNNVILNIAKIRNRGLEFDLRGDVVRSKNFQWNAALNISRNVSKVLNISGGPFSDPNNRGSLALGTSIVKEGEPLGLLYGYQVKGIIRDQKQLDNYKKAFPFSPFIYPYLNLGDYEYEIDSATHFPKQAIIGHAYPKFYGGVTNTFSYKNFTLIALLTFSYGNQLIYQNDVNSLSFNNVSNRGIRILDHYSADNTNSERPRLVYSAGVNLSQKSVFDASYLKLKSITLSYDLPKSIVDRVKFRNASLYMSATNLFTITSYPGLDPEVTDNPGSIIGGGRDVSSYPTTRGFIMGLRLGL